MKVKMYLHWTKDYLFPEGKFELWPIEMTSCPDKMFLEEMEVEVPDTAAPTQEEITTWLVTKLRKQKEAILAETHMQVSKIEEQIQQLLCLPSS